MTRLKTYLDRTNAVFEWVCYRLLELIVIVIMLQVILRFVFNSPTKWSEEVAMISLVWFGMLAVAIGVRTHSHIAITFFRDLLAVRNGILLDYLAQILILVFSVIVAINAMALVELTSLQKLPASGFPKWMLYFSAVVGGGLATLNAIGNIAFGDVRLGMSEQNSYDDLINKDCDH